MEYQAIIDETSAAMLAEPDQGAVADYIPELACIDPEQFGLALHCLDGRGFESGETRTRFSLQSIAKVFGLVLAVSAAGEAVWTRVGVEPSGDPFNSLIQLEYEHGIPRNPLINAGAIVIADFLVTHYDNPKRELLDFVRQMAREPSIEFNASVAASEATHGYRNLALANFMKAFDNLVNDIDDVLDVYFHLCALEMNCNELARAFLFLADAGRLEGEQVISKAEARRVNAIMLTCGFYDESGDFAFRVGLPGKSGVGGGIVAIQPHEYAVAAWSPRLNAKGNSYRGMRALRMLAERTGATIF